MPKSRYRWVKVWCDWCIAGVDEFAKFRRWFTDKLIHLLFFLRGYTSVSFEEIKRRQYASEGGFVPFNLDGCKAIDEVLEQTGKMVEGEESRLEHVWEKFKVMLTICGLLLAAIGALFSKYQKSPDFAVWMAVPMVLLALAGFVLFVFHEAGTVYSVILEQEEVALSRDDLLKSLINSNMSILRSMGGKIDFFVDLYQVCRSILVVAWIMFMFSWLVLVLSPNQPASSEKLQLIEGPPGPPGPPGLQGPSRVPLWPTGADSAQPLDERGVSTPPARRKTDFFQRGQQW